MTDWEVYMILCDDGSLYTGISRDVARRFAEHGSSRGAKYFRGRRPRRIVYLETGHTRSSASRREAAIKTLSRAKKEQLLSAGSNEADHLDPPGRPVPKTN